MQLGMETRQILDTDLERAFGSDSGFCSTGGRATDLGASSTARTASAGPRSNN